MQPDTGSSRVVSADRWAAAGSLVAGLVVLTILTGFPHAVEIDRTAGYLPDTFYDWMVARAAWDGYGTHNDLDVLAYHYAVAEIGVSAPSSRPPGGILLLSPITLVPPEVAMHIINLASLVGGLAACWYTALMIGVPPWKILIVSPVGFVLAHLSWLFGSNTLLVAGLVVSSWWLACRGREAASGTLMAIGACIKMWPLLILLTWFLKGRHRTATYGFTAFLLLNAGAMALPGISLVPTITAMLRGGDYFAASTHNGSLAGWAEIMGGEATVAWVLIALWWTIAIIRAKSFDAATSVAVVAALLASPIVSWGYWWSAGPLAGAAVLSGRRAQVVPAGSALLLWAAGTWFNARLLGLWVLVSGLLLSISVTARALEDDAPQR